MACEREQEKVNQIVAKLSRLEAELEAAAPPKKPAIVKKIEALEAPLEQAKDDLRACKQKHGPPTTPFDATLNVLFSSNQPWGFFNEYGVRRSIRITGRGNTRTFAFDDIEVVRKKDGVETRTLIKNMKGTLKKDDGAMTLTAEVELPFGASVYRVPVSLVTGTSQSPNGLFILTGSPLSGTNFTLVGTGEVKDILTVEFQITVEGVFDTAP
ncbi:MAG: hypothetical protein IPK82_07590 [Polyangiaceae bacterium]|nr:hypothetical protein [Polyangiaceae bacterium]